MAICQKDKGLVAVIDGRCICTRESTNPFVTRPCPYMAATIEADEKKDEKPPTKPVLRIVKTQQS